MTPAEARLQQFLITRRLWLLRHPSGQYLRTVVRGVPHWTPWPELAWGCFEPETIIDHLKQLGPIHNLPLECCTLDQITFETPARLFSEWTWRPHGST